MPLGVGVYGSRGATSNMGGDTEGAPSTAHVLHWNMVLYDSEPHLGTFNENSELEWMTYREVMACYLSIRQKSGVLHVTVSSAT